LPDGRFPILVLARGCGERILVPQYGISLTVLGVRGQKVRIGVAAPSDVEVYREEVWERLSQEAHGLDELATEPQPAKG
jgi:carbon storage regulator